MGSQIKGQGSDEEVAANNTLTEQCIQVEPKSVYHA
jgi:hypothetical protein